LDVAFMPKVYFIVPEQQERRRDVYIVAAQL
jgi:hypothetical protein